MTPFVVFTLPRSRSTWLSRFLSYGDWRCGHDELRHMRQIEDIKSWLSQPLTGTIETGGAAFWRLARDLRPDLRIAVVRREPDEAAHSAVRCGLAADLEATRHAFRRMDAKLGQIERRLGVRSVRYEDLAQEETCAALFEHLLPYAHDTEWWRALVGVNLQIDPVALNRYVGAHLPQIARLHGIARQKSLALLQSRQRADVGGLTIALEPLRALLRDGEQAMRDHCAEVGESPAGWGGKNLTALQALEDADALQVAIARCNGRVVGYLVSTIGESLEAADRLWACHTAFYASPDHPGVGLRLQRRAADGLRARGVHEVVMRAGVRGSADRVSALYRRLGAEPFGSYYRLQLGRP